MSRAIGEFADWRWTDVSKLLARGSSLDGYHIEMSREGTPERPILMQVWRDHRQATYCALHLSEEDGWKWAEEHIQKLRAAYPQL